MVHRSGVAFPEQAGPFRRVSAYHAENGGALFAEYADPSGRFRVQASVRDRDGLDASARYHEVRSELIANGGGRLPPAEADPRATVLAGSTNFPDDTDGVSRGRITSYRVETIGGDFLECRAAYPASERAAGAAAFARFRSDLPIGGEQPSRR